MQPVTVSAAVDRQFFFISATLTRMRVCGKISEFRFANTCRLFAGSLEEGTCIVAQQHVVLRHLQAQSDPQNQLLRRL